MNMVKDFLIFIAGIVVIIKSADLFTDGAEGIARAFKISRVIIGLTIVSFATTAPEFTVSVFSSYLGVGGMAVGNAIGSCLCNIGLIFIKGLYWNFLSSLLIFFYFHRPA